MTPGEEAYSTASAQLGLPSLNFLLSPLPCMARPWCHAGCRFDEMRSQFFAFLGFWIFQMLWVWLVSLPVIFLNSAEKDVELGVRDYIGWALWYGTERRADGRNEILHHDTACCLPCRGLGFFFEVVADQSKDSFMNNPENRGRVGVNLYQGSSTLQNITRLTMLVMLSCGADHHVRRLVRDSASELL